MTSSPHQAMFDDLGTPLSEATFVVFDFETTGGSAERNAVTEIGAVKFREGEVIGEFQTLVNPLQTIPASIVLLTGITDEMVRSAPTINQVLPSFLEFIGSAVLVAHNASFDMRFLKTNSRRLHYTPPANTVVDTLSLARKLLTKDEVPNHKLSTLSRFFKVGTSPSHRALDDARATGEVLHGLFERLGGLGVTHVEDLPLVIKPDITKRREKQHLTKELPNSPGVYIFKDSHDQVLYVGKSRNVKKRVRGYFTAAETRKRIDELIARLHEISVIPCPTELEASIRELRLIHKYQPPYNQKSRRDAQAPWIRLTNEPFPRLSVVRKIQAPESGPTFIGPFHGSRQARLALEGLHRVFQLRQCLTRLPLKPRPHANPCVLKDLGKCGAPCVGEQSQPAYDELVADFANSVSKSPQKLVATLERQMRDLAKNQQYEAAAECRDQLAAILYGLMRTQGIVSLARCKQIIAARPCTDGGWELTIIRFGKLAGTTVATKGIDPLKALQSLKHTAATITPSSGVLPAGSPQEAEMILRWLRAPGTRLVEINGQWSSPVHGAERYRHLHESLVATTRHDDAYRDL